MISPLLASNAALALDNHILKRENIDYSPIYQLSQDMDKCARDEAFGMNFEISYFITPVENYFNEKCTAQISDLTDKVLVIAKDLESFSNAEKSQQERLRAFCLDLCRYVSVYHETNRRWLVA